MFLLESLMPIPFLAPGAKLGLSNIITIAAIYLLGTFDAFIILTLRIMLSAIFVGSPMVILFSITGGLLSFVSMIICKRFEKFSIIGVSAAGGFFHNLGQIIVAIFVMNSPKIINYLPVLGICGIFTGIIIGIIAMETVKRIKNWSLDNEL